MFFPLKDLLEMAGGSCMLLLLKIIRQKSSRFMWIKIGGWKKKYCYFKEGVIKGIPIYRFWGKRGVTYDSFSIAILVISSVAKRTTNNPINQMGSRWIRPEVRNDNLGYPFADANQAHYLFLLEVYTYFYRFIGIITFLLILHLVPYKQSSNYPIYSVQRIIHVLLIAAYIWSVSFV